MRSEARAERRKRQMLSAHLDRQVLAFALRLRSEADLDPWTIGDSLVRRRNTGLLWGVFTTLALKHGMSQVSDHMRRPLTEAPDSTLLELLAEDDATGIAARLGDLGAGKEFDFDQVDIDGEPRVGLAGDWHGNMRWAQKSLEKFHHEGVRTVLHLGDFGLWPGQEGAQYLATVSDLCSEWDITIYVTDGNHEDHSALASIEPEDGKRWISDRVAFFERGHRWTWRDRVFLSLGGAASIDYQYRTRGRDWWAEEVTSAADVTRAVAGGEVDVLLTHDSPAPGTPAVEGILRSNPLGLPHRVLQYAREGRSRVTEAFHAVQPRLNVHGHMHVVDQHQHVIEGFDHETTTISLGCDDQSGNLAILDIDTLEVDVLP